MWFSPVFVLAPVRSNSSVVTAMIGQHPELYWFPELALFRGATIGDMLADPRGWKGVPTQLRMAGLYRALAQEHDGEQTPESIAAAREWVEQRRAWSAADVLDHLLRLVAPRVAIEKSPENSSRDAYLDRLAAAYPRARYLHVTRHPATAIASMHRVWSTRDYWQMSPELLHHFCAGVWYFQHRRIVRFTSTLPPDRALQVRSEELLGFPERVLPRVCKWLGIDRGAGAVEAMLHPEHSPYACIGPQGALGGADSGFLREPAVRRAPMPDTVSFPSGWKVDPWLQLSAIELARRLGYSEPAVPSPPGAAAHPRSPCDRQS